MVPNSIPRTHAYVSEFVMTKTDTRIQECPSIDSAAAVPGNNAYRKNGFGIIGLSLYGRGRIKREERAVRAPVILIPPTSEIAIRRIIGNGKVLGLSAGMVRWSIRFRFLCVRPI